MSEKSKTAELVQLPHQREVEVRADEAGLAIDKAIGEVFQGSLDILVQANRFADIPPGMTIEDDPPLEWMPEVPKKDRIRAWRVAHYALMSAKDGPQALKMAGRTVECVMRGMDRFMGKQDDLHMGPAVEMPVPKFEEVEVDD